LQLAQLSENFEEILRLMIAAAPAKGKDIALDKLKIDLFDKRLAVYEATKIFISVATIQLQVTENYLAGLRTVTRGREFLFDG